jgi:hypothetical protein
MLGVWPELTGGKAKDTGTLSVSFNKRNYEKGN